jgi:hypothetical protein
VHKRSVMHRTSNDTKLSWCMPSSAHAPYLLAGQGLRNALPTRPLLIQNGRIVSGENDVDQHPTLNDKGRVKIVPASPPHHPLRIEPANPVCPCKTANQRIDACGNGARGADLVVTAVQEDRDAAASIVRMFAQAQAGRERRIEVVG